MKEWQYHVSHPETFYAHLNHNNNVILPYEVFYSVNRIQLSVTQLDPIVTLCARKGGYHPLFSRWKNQVLDT